MKKSVLLHAIVGVILATSFTIHASARMTDAERITAAKMALELTERSPKTPLVVDDSLPSHMRDALASQRELVLLSEVPEKKSAVSKVENYSRILQFREDGDKIEFSRGTTYPKAYHSGECRRFEERLVLVRAPNGEWKQEGPSTIRICNR
jgi:hypothetical protein